MPDRLQITIRRMRIECWISKATNTHAQYVILMAFPLKTMVARTHLSITLYVHCLSCYTYKDNLEVQKCVKPSLRLASLDQSIHYLLLQMSQFYQHRLSSNTVRVQVLKCYVVVIL